MSQTQSTHKITSKPLTKQEEFSELLRPYEEALLKIERRLYFIEAVENQWRDKLEGETFIVKNDVFWMMYMDMYKILVIDLSSYLKGLFSTGGFINKMNSFLSLLRVPGKNKIDPPKGTISFLNYQPTAKEIKAMHKDMDIQFQVEYQKKVQEILKNLFPRLKKIDDHNNINYKITQNDINELKDRLNLHEHKILEIRHEFAHQYDPKIKKKFFVKAPIDKIRELTNTLEKFLNDFKNIITSSTMGYDDMNHIGSKQAAEDFIELVLFGTIKNIVNEFGISSTIGDSKKAQSSPVYFHQFRKKYWDNHKIPIPKKNHS